MRPVVLATLLALAAPLTAVSPTVARPAEPSATPPAAAAAAATTLKVSTYVGGLNHPWDVKSIGSGRLLVTERDPARLSIVTKQGRRTVRFPTGQVWTSGETGLMGLEVDPAFAKNRRFYTCQGATTARGRHDVRVNAWTLNPAATRARFVRTLLSGLPATTGRHGGCRLLIADNGALVVGTGDAAVGTNPRNLRSLGGKTLRLHRGTGRPWPTNPFVRSSQLTRRYVLTYGHRNVQGLAQRADGTLWSVEHGSSRDDEVNRLVRGGDYGWNPVPGYDESVPMTDRSLPGKQYPARWRSGSSTVATSGATFVYGKQWGSLRGMLAVAVLKDEQMLFLRFTEDGRLTRAVVPAAPRGTYGRLRTATRLPNGNLAVTTDADGGNGRVLIVSPR